MINVENDKDQTLFLSPRLPGAVHVVVDVVLFLVPGPRPPSVLARVPGLPGHCAPPLLPHHVRPRGQGPVLLCKDE